MDNKRVIISCFILFILLLLVPPVLADTNTLIITVTDDYDDSAIKGASVYAAGTYVGTTNSYGEFEYTHSKSSNFRLTVEKEGYDTWTDIISHTKSFQNVEMERETGTLQINILDADSLQPLENAIVQITSPDTDDSKSTYEDGSVKFSVNVGSTYIVEIKKDSYNTLVKEVEIKERSQSVDYLMQRNDLVIFRVSESETGLPIEGASIYIDGNLEGTTDTDGRYTSYIDHERSYNIEIKVNDYQSYQENHYFSSDDILYSVSISKTLYPVSIAVYDSGKVPIENAEIYIDGEFFGKSDDYGQSGVTNLDAGRHNFEIRKSGYSDWTKDVLVDGENDNIIATMESVRADVTIVVEDENHNTISGAYVMIDGTSLGSTNSEGILKTELETNSDYTFYVEKDGYVDLTESRSVPLGSTEMTITLTMKNSFNAALLGGVVVLIIIIGLVVYALKFAGNKGGGRSGGKGRPPGGRDGGSL